MHLKVENDVCVFLKGKKALDAVGHPPRVVSSRQKCLNLVYYSMVFLWFSCPNLSQMSLKATLASLAFSRLEIERHGHLNKVP